MANKTGRIRRESSNSGDNVCTLCCQDSSIWVISPCDHPVCLTCATRLRVLCEVKECPVCRESNEKVVVVEKRLPFSSISYHKMIEEDRYGFVFTKHSFKKEFESLISLHCSKCNDHPYFSNLKSLQDHLRKEHELFFCELCLSHLNLFPSEHKLYTRQQLSLHRRQGDPDDSAHKGHPLCKFCAERFLDNEALFIHLKNEHFWCHFCEADGKQDYYASYSQLRVHFREAHFLCSEGPCRYEKFTSVFRTKLDLQAHKTKVHAKGLSKAEAKQLRYVDVGFMYTREDGGDGLPPVSQRRGIRRATKQPHYGENREDVDMQIAKALSLQEKTSSDTQSSSEDKHTSSQDILPQQLPSDVKQDEPKVIIRKPPPGLESLVMPTTLPVSSSLEKELEEQQPTEWPLLGTEVKEPTPNKPPGFAQVTSGVVNNTNSLPRVTVLTSNPPPGFSMSMKNKAVMTDRIKMSENDIFETARRLLDNDKRKINQFRRCSGNYQRGDITVNEYYKHCVSLFGSAWKEFGTELAHTIPDDTKRQELLSLCKNNFIIEEPENPYTHFPPPGLTTSSSNKSKKANKSNSGAWSLSEKRSKGKLSLNDDEFPSLQTASQMPDPVLALPSWNMKVTVK